MRGQTEGAPPSILGLSKFSVIMICCLTIAGVVLWRMDASKTGKVAEASEEKEERGSGRRSENPGEAREVKILIARTPNQRVCVENGGEESCFKKGQVPCVKYSMIEDRKVCMKRENFDPPDDFEAARESPLTDAGNIASCPANRYYNGACWR